MSMVGEIENVEREIAHKEEELFALYKEINDAKDVSSNKINKCALEIFDLEERLEGLEKCGH